MQVAWVHCLAREGAGKVIARKCQTCHLSTCNLLKERENLPHAETRKENNNYLPIYSTSFSSVENAEGKNKNAESKNKNAESAVSEYGGEAATAMTRFLCVRECLTHARAHF